MYYLPQEVEVWYVIPAIRKELSKILVRNHKLTLEKVGGILGVSKAAISQYLHNKRADRIKLNKKVKHEIEKAARIIIKDNNRAVEEMMKILNLMKTWECTCDVCRKYNKGILKQCKAIPVYKS